MANTERVGACNQLRGLLVQLDARTDRKEEVARLFDEILQLGRRWQDQSASTEAEQKAFDRLSKQLKRFSEAQQKELLSTFRPLRDEFQKRLSKAAGDVNGWLSEAPDDKATPERLSTILQALEAVPQLKSYKQWASNEVKAKFLMALASLLRAVQGVSAPLYSHVKSHPTVLASIERLSSAFFVVPSHGNILKLWHDGRLKRYNATLWRAAKRAADQYKDDLQVLLVTALKKKVCGSGSYKSNDPLQLKLRKWPMVKCPLATTFLDFVTKKGKELGELGNPELIECPPHSLRPRTLCRLLERLDAFEVVEGDGGKDSSSMVRLRMQAVTALAFKSLGAKPKASSAPPEKKNDTAAQGAAADVVSSGESGSASSSESPQQSKATQRQDTPRRRRLGSGDSSVAGNGTAGAGRALKQKAAAGSPQANGAHARVKAANVANAAADDGESSSGYESTEDEVEREKEERRKLLEKKTTTTVVRKRKREKIAYGEMDHSMMNQMMMNQTLMGMQMMMNNPMIMMNNPGLAAMASTPAMAAIAAAGMKQLQGAAADQAKKIKVDPKLQKSGKVADPRLNKAAAKAATEDNMAIDASDL